MKVSSNKMKIWKLVKKEILSKAEQKKITCIVDIWSWNTWIFHEKPLRINSSNIPTAVTGQLQKWFRQTFFLNLKFRYNNGRSDRLSCGGMCHVCVNCERKHL